ncbi:MAG: hypothetical protein OEZ10_10685 [Gammaproteobacteria bacterium]|nr:hypothetical protein [Gammaproteobacteria bacterium]
MTASSDDQKRPNADTFERRAGGDRRGGPERRGPTRWDPRNAERRCGEDRRRPSYLVLSEEVAEATDTTSLKTETDRG